MDLLTEKLAVICPVDEQTPIAYMNVFDAGDVWVKVRGCEDCPQESRERCCGKVCGMFTSKGCFFHFENMEKKPYRCVVYPIPNVQLSWCVLEFKCIQGPKAGLIHRVQDPANEFIDA